jgi:hypothetical protein
MILFVRPNFIYHSFVVDLLLNQPYEAVASQLLLRAADVMDEKVQQSSPVTDSVPSLITQLCKLHLLQSANKPINPAASFCLHERKQLMKRKLKIKAFETIFCYLKDCSLR